MKRLDRNDAFTSATLRELDSVIGRLLRIRASLRGYDPVPADLGQKEAILTDLELIQYGVVCGVGYLSLRAGQLANVNLAPSDWRWIRQLLLKADEKLQQVVEMPLGSAVFNQKEPL